MGQRKPKRDPEPVVLGESWRSQMTDECESLAALVWKRVHRRHGIDLSDKRQATAEQIFRLLEPLMGYERITVDMLSELVDKRVAKIFTM